MLSESSRRRILACETFLVILPDTTIDGTEQEAQLRFAVSYDRYIVVWRPTDRAHLPVPSLLSSSTARWEVVDGDRTALVRRMVELRASGLLPPPP